MMSASHREGERDEEVPAPAERVGDDAAEKRAADGRDSHHGAEEAHVAAALARADDVGHDHLAERGKTAGADALHRAEGDERRGVLREAGRGGGEDEDHDGELDEQLAVEQVGELAPHGCRDRGRQQGCGDDPREGGLVPAEVVDDDGERGRDDGRGQHRHEHAEEEPGERQEHGAVPTGFFVGRAGRGAVDSGQANPSGAGADAATTARVIDKGQQLMTVNYMLDR